VGTGDVSGLSGLDLDGVDAALVGTRFRGELRYLASVTSTNSLAMEAAQRGARSGVWIAEEQTGGRGRGGHGWHSAWGEGLYVSALVAPGVAASRAMWISLATALAASSAISEAGGASADIRWPNDLLVNGMKCGGILVESAIAAGETEASENLRYAVIGVGINVNHESFPESLRGVATSLRMAVGRPIDREALLVSLLRGLENELARLGAEQAGELTGPGLLERFMAASTWTLGKHVRVGEGDGYTGVTAGLSPDGFLRVEADDGTERTVRSGGVRAVT